MTEPAAVLPAPPHFSAVLPPATLALTGVTRAFGGRLVLGPVHLTLDTGVLAVLTGANGAGKTTLLRIAAGRLAPSAGTRVCAGRAVYLRPGGGARAALTVGQAFAHTAALTGSPQATVTAAAAASGLTALIDRRVGELSAGQQARLSAALAVAASPALACLDEPTAHLDEDSVGRVRETLGLLLAAGTTVLAASHNPDHVADLADAVLRLDAGLLTVAAC